ncbi:MAG: fasciclin domain-containing protein, partial [Euryarchaeota archaeon]|nr:fasciclin domain-containing protein [Euryarchaeota archaeon]
MKRALASLILASLLMTTLPLNVAADATEDIPTNAAATGVHDSLVAALTHADLVATLQGDGPFTVFAPTDAAFAAAGIDLADFDTDEENATLSDILLYHVYSGSVAAADVTDGLTVAMVNGDDATFAVAADGTVSIGDAKVTTADVQASNGIIHVIDAVLTPPADAPTLDIPATAQSTGVHTALVAALTQANLVSALQADGPFTVFAPTDAAFTAAGIDLSTFDTPEENATLADILTYHVYSGAVPSSAVTDGLAVNMLNGDKA